MMREREQRILVTLLLGLSMALIFWAAESMQFFGTERWSTAARGWFEVVNISDNSFGWWRINPLLAALSLPDYLLGPVHLALLCLGIFFWLSLYLPLGRAAGSAILIGALLLIVIGLPLRFISAFAMLPWLCWLLSSAHGKHQHRLPAALIAGMLLLLLSANFLFIPLLILAAAAVQPAPPRVRAVLLAGIFIGGALSVLEAPALRLPDYPPFSKVVPNDSAMYQLRPFVGTLPAIAVIDYDSLRAEMLPVNIGLAILAVIASAILLSPVGAAVAVGPRRAILSGLVLAVSAIWESATPPAWVEIGPLHAIGRIITPLSTVSMAPYAAGAGLLLLLTGLTALAPRATPLLTTVLLAAALSRPLLPLIGGEERALLQSAMRSQRGAVSGNASERLISPSLAVLRRTSLAFVDPPMVRSLRPIPLAADQLLASHNSTPKFMRHLLDGDLHSRWSRRDGTQRGDEWLCIDFKSPTPISRIKLDTGEYRTDYPRGVRLSAAAACPEPGAADELRLLTIYDATPWRGPLRYTSDGYPYWGWEGEVQIDLREPVTMRALIVEQSGRSNRFDWSVAELEIFTPSM